MKKLLSLIVVLMLLLTTAFAESTDYTLPEKMQRQLQAGNGGLKGTVSFESEGDAEWCTALKLLNSVDFRFTAIQDSSGWQLKAWAQDGEAERGVTWLWQTVNGYMASSELLPDDLVSLDAGKVGNPDWYSMAAMLLSLTDEDLTNRWEPAYSGLKKVMEQWLDKYASTPVTTQDANGSSVMSVSYDIPEEDLKDGMVLLVQTALNDSDLMALMTTVSTEEQETLYLNPEYMSVYETIIRGLKLTGGVHLEREMTIRGEDVRTAIVVPSPIGAFETVRLEAANGVTTLTMTGEKLSAELTYQKTDDGLSGSLRIIPAKPGMESMAFSAAFTVSSQKTSSTDEEYRTHDTTTWKITAEKDLSHLSENDETRDAYVDFEPVTVNVTVDFASKSAQRNPTILTVTADLSSGENKAAVNAEMKTASPWDTETLPDSDGEELTEMTSERKNELLSQLNEAFTNLCNELNSTRAESDPAAGNADTEQTTDNATGTDAGETGNP